MVRIQIRLAQHLRIGLRLQQLVAVVRNQHLLLADQLPVETVGAAVPGLDLIEAHHAGGRRRRRIAAWIRQLAHAALAGQVHPCLVLAGVDIGAPTIASPARSADRN
jgi:shikimate kinase